MSIYEQPIYCPSCGCRFYEVKKVKPGRFACVCPKDDCGMQGPHRTTRKAAIRDFVKLGNVEAVKDAAEFEARVAQRLVQNMTWPCYVTLCPEGKDKDIDYLICEKEEWCHMKHARLAVEEEMEKGEGK